MDAFDETNARGVQRHDHRGRTYAFTEEAYAAHDDTFGDTGGGKDDLLAGGEFFGGVDLVNVRDSHLVNAIDLVGLYQQASLHVAVEAADGRGGDYTFRSTTGSHNGVDTSVKHSGGDASREIAVSDQTYAGTGLADVVDESFVTRTIENDDDEIGNIAIQGFG